MPSSVSESFERLLESVDLHVGATRRVSLAHRQRYVPTPGATTLVYVDSGVVRGSRAAQPILHAEHMGPGAAFITTGQCPITLEADTDAMIVVVTIELDESRQRLRELLPDPLTSREFRQLDPAVAALASNMGTAEHAEPAPLKRAGDAVICELMARTVFLAVLRAWYAAGCAPRDWSARAADPHLGRVLSAIHADPGKDWTVTALASLGAMSRSALARRFRDLTGASPGQYLSEVRMENAKRRLAAGGSVSQTSRELGYASDEGFSRAFRRHTGVPPSRWRGAGRAAAATS